MYVGKIPLGVQDSLVRELLDVCGRARHSPDTHHTFQLDVSTFCVG